MTLKKLILENFGPYKGLHAIDLEPPSPKRPIVLLGGLNGSGKTTLLDALQLVMYGKRARCSTRGTSAYDEFLKKSINRHSDPSGGARIELQFYDESDGQRKLYRLCRAWHANGSVAREIVEVFINGTYDQIISEAWSEYAEEFIPARLSHLFFFDGEKIEALAELANAAEVLRSGIHSLLGLDLIERLRDDLKALAGRKGKLLLQYDDGTQDSLARAEMELRELQSRRDELVQDCAGLQLQSEQCVHRLHEMEARLQAEGGELFRQRDLLQAEKRAIGEELESIDVSLREITSGPAPFLLVPELLVEVRQQARQERLSIQASGLQDVLCERDRCIVELVSQWGATKALCQRLDRFLTKDRHERTQARTLPRYLGLSEETEGLLQDLESATLPALTTKAATLIVRRKELTHALVSLERKLSAVPDEEAIAPLERERTELESKKASIEEVRSRLEEQRKNLEVEFGRKESVVTRLQEKAIRNRLEREDLVRINEHARKAEEALGDFRERVVDKHIARIQMNVEDSFRHLIRKQTLVSSLKIHKRTYELELRDCEGQVIPAERLSAGERQLLAVSLLWGLAKTSRRQLPAVIDTPLGRLDSSHRRHLVERYFPAASHQVLLLSTDEEIRDEYLVSLRPWIGHEYLIAYDESTRTSKVMPGNFGSEGVHAA